MDFDERIFFVKMLEKLSCCSQVGYRTAYEVIYMYI